MYAATIYSLLLTFSIFFCAHVKSDEQIYTVGVEDYPHFLPYSQYQGGVYSGLGRDIMDAFLDGKPYRFEYVVLPLKRMDQDFVDGKLGLIFPQNPNWVQDLKAGLDIAYAPMLEFTDGLIVLKQNAQDAHLKLKVLGVPLGFTPYPYFEDIHAKTIRTIEATDYNSLYLMLIRERIDGAYMNSRIANYYWRAIMGEKSPPITLAEDAPQGSGYWHLASFKHKDIIEEFRHFMDENPQLIRKLKEKWRFDSFE
ncbi:hypothetical protein P2G88_00300 [Aliiglaciecola sp. CAU 1673]|uniref:substrate-binding periplasmic protein n=1 Tax=Aliiglaciecola sp. CAU 1673 TaxID=3032595 RepID=UPI0023DA08E4|nr:hypothetical protein [Aliiglaciecola sp. CAU 1673]MDF2176687.1 hypothetical protein [Aliiglaciecola sp. CAU 1673]